MLGQLLKPREQTTYFQMMPGRIFGRGEHKIECKVYVSHFHGGSILEEYATYQLKGIRVGTSLSHFLCLQVVEYRLTLEQTTHSVTTANNKT